MTSSCLYYGNLTQVTIITLLKTFANLIKRYQTWVSCIAGRFFTSWASKVKINWLFNIIVQMFSVIEHFCVFKTINVGFIPLSQVLAGYLYFSTCKLPAHFPCLFWNSGVLFFLLLRTINKRSLYYSNIIILPKCMYSPST